MLFEWSHMNRWHALVSCVRPFQLPERNSECIIAIPVCKKIATWLLPNPNAICTWLQVSKSKPAGEKVAKAPKVAKLPLQSSSGFNIDVNDVDVKAVKTTKREPQNDKSIEETYQKKTQLEHILLRPDTYVGSIEKHTQSLWVYEDEKMVNRSVTFVPGLYKIFDEILVNAADNKQRDPSMDTVKVGQFVLILFQSK